MLFRHRMERRINLYAENTRYLEMKRKIVQKGRSKAMHDSALSRTLKVCKTHGRYRFEVGVPSLFEEQTTSRIRIVNGVEKYVREAKPIQEEERASGKGRDQNGNRHQQAIGTLFRLNTEKWIDMKRSKDPYCFMMSKFITQLLRHKEVGREEDARVLYDRIVEKCKEVLSEDSRYWSDEEKPKSNMAPHWSAEKWIDVLSKGGGQKKRFQ